MANTKDELRVSRNFANLLSNSEALLYKSLNILFDVQDFTTMQKINHSHIRLEEDFDEFGRIDILIENNKCFFIIENKVHSQTDPQETQTTAYFDLMKKKEKEGKETFICYLINDGHPIDEFKSATKKYQNSKIVFWSNLINTLYKTSGKEDRQEIESFVLYSKDEIDNFEVDLEGSGKIFGYDADLLSNPYLLSTLGDFFCGSETYNRILNSLVVPALEKIENVSNVHIDNADYDFAVFTYKGKEYWLNLTTYWNPDKESYFYKNSFTFYRPWIFGCQNATTENQMIEYTKEAILLWLNDIDAQTKDLPKDENDEDFDYSELAFGEDREVFSNPYLLANANYLISSKKPKAKKLTRNGCIYESIIIPAMEKASGITEIELSEYYRNVTVGFKYKGREMYVDLNGFYDAQTDKTYDYHSFTFYRPWIIGVRYAASEQEMIEYTEKAIELWLKDVDKIFEELN